MAATESQKRNALNWLTGRVRKATRVVRFDGPVRGVPSFCACCGRRPAGSSRAERRRADGQSIIVPYCAECHRHACATATRTLAVGLSSALLSLTAALTLPLCYEWMSAALYLLAMALLVGAPLALGGLVASGPGDPPHAPGRAAWWLRDGTLACIDERWAEDLAELNRATVTVASAAERLWSPWMLAAPVAVLVACPFVIDYLRPEVRVLNLTEQRMVLFVEGRRLAFIGPSSAESPSSGVDIRVPAGSRTLEARSVDGSSLERSVVRLQAGRQHLFAPGSPEYCFWLERTSYGRQGSFTARTQPLAGPSRFWTLPDDVDTWFSPNPPAASGDAVSTGGALTALRQGRCLDGPERPRPEEAGPTTGDLAGRGGGL